MHVELNLDSQITAVFIKLIFDLNTFNAYFLKKSRNVIHLASKTRESFGNTYVRSTGGNVCRMLGG